MAVAHKQRKAPPRHRHNAPVHEMMTPNSVQEMIGRVAPPYMQKTALMRSSRYTTTVDATVPDYEFYDKLRRGKQPGYKLGALFAKRIEHILTVWVLGRGVTITLAEAGDAESETDPRNYTDSKLADFIEREHAQLMVVKEDALGLGDQYIFVNPDGTLSIPSPDTVEITRDPLDYRIILKVTITAKLPTVTILDEYRPDGRTVTYKEMVDGKEVVTVEKYDILIGRIPMIHVAHGRSSNETNGHSIHEDLLKLYDQYDDVIHKQLDGAKLLGNPILAFVGMEDLNAVIDANKPLTDETYLDRDGNEITRPMLNVDANSVMLIGKGGDGKFIAPPVGFTADTTQAMKSLFELAQFRTGIPEFAWGPELSSARATSDTQMEQWARDIEGTQKYDQAWLLELCAIWLLFMALSDPQIVADEELKAEWPPVLDTNQDMRLKMLTFASQEGLLQAKTKLELTDLPVDNIDEEIAAGQVEAQARADQEQQRTIDVAKATKPMPNMVAQMGENGYNEGEENGLIHGAIRREAERILAGEE